MKILHLIIYILLFRVAAHAETDRGNVLINEVQVANIDRYIDHSFNYGSWIELYNTTDSPISLSSMRLVHTSADGVVSQQTLTASHGSIPAHGYVNLWFDHNSKDGYFGSGAVKQIAYKLDTDGGIIELRNPSGTVIDAIEYPSAIARCSWARTTDGSNVWAYTSTPTPESTNAGSDFATQRLDAPTVDADGTVFTSPFTFTVSIPKGTTLYYTTDGSAPVRGSSKTSNDGRFSVDTTIIYRFMLSAEGYLDSPVVTRSFIHNDKGYYLPVLSVSTHPDNLFDNTIGLYVRGTNGRTANNSKTPANQNMDWERPVNMEYIVPDDLGRYNYALNQEATFSLFGGWTRFNNGHEPFQHTTSFKLKAEKQYEGQNFFPYPVFDSKPYIKLKDLLVRNGGQDQHCRIWDAALQEILRTSGISIDCQAWQPAHIFLNGLYLGMLNLREASNHKYAFSNYGIGSDEIDQWENEFQVKQGDSKLFNTWIALAQQVAAYPTDTAVWKRLTDILDIDEYCNYMAAETYMGNADWLRTDLKNIKGFCAKTDDGKIHIVVYDLDACFGDTDLIERIMVVKGKQCTIFRNMMNYQPFRKQFIDTYCLMGGSVFTPEHCLPIIASMANTTNAALSIEGNESMSKAEKLCEAISDRTDRYVKLMNSLRKAFKLGNPYELNISSDLPSSRLLVNQLEIPTGRFDGQLFAPVSLTAVAPAGYKFSCWEVDDMKVSTDSVYDLSEELSIGMYKVKAVFEKIEEKELFEAGITPVRINEVSAKNDIYIDEYMKKSDWIELYNTTDKPVDIAGMYLTDNRRKPQKYQIPRGKETVIEPHGYKIVWCDGNEGDKFLHAPFKLENADGGYVAIHAADNSWADSLVYQAQGRWQTFGRYPDGSNNVALFDRITIEQPNRINTHTSLSYQGSGNQTTHIRNVQGADRRVVDVRYYNLNGQQIQSPSEARIVIQRITYDDGSSLSRKIMQR